MTQETIHVKTHVKTPLALLSEKMGKGRPGGVITILRISCMRWEMSSRTCLLVMAGIEFQVT